MNISRKKLVLPLLGSTLLCVSAVAGAQAQAEGPAVIPSDVMTRYTVNEGDSLWTIAGQDDVYGSPYLWPLLLKANTDHVTDADVLRTGQVLVIPRNASKDEQAAAMALAKKRGPWKLGAVEDPDLSYLGR